MNNQIPIFHNSLVVYLMYNGVVLQNIGKSKNSGGGNNMKLKNFVNDENGLSITDLEKIVLNLMFSIFTIAITYVYVKYRFIDMTATYLDLSIGGLLVARKGLKYNLVSKQTEVNNISSVDSVNTTIDQPQG